ncbi:uncharacterized protein LOC106160286 [Lingula anatina]|uniref:Uncharacterized protein LOC106160286 n=1 Tax=Lingula anatina TaxID=7574 RepID=A0A1S3I4J5_LINAN|nr:uncharacterized protein LOC106160286 [Lingula anatina]|eukprot:XP_013392289.1 uncharacterized protein LOC106160286 [Lingula anatina]
MKGQMSETKTPKNILNLGELVHEDPPGSFARHLMSLNLPTKDNNFCGREVELREIQQDMNNKTEVLLLTGMGGIGKTSIAVEMGHRMSEEGRDVLFLDMRQVGKLDLFRLLLVQHYNLEEITNPNADLHNLFQKTLSDIKSATVVIFDNIDHLLSDEKRKEFLKLVQDMLKASKHLALVCTSRESFDLMSVKVVERHIPPLDDSSSTQLLFQLTPEREAGVLKEIAARCGHSPLALKLLASQIENKGSLQVLEEMKEIGVSEVAHDHLFEGLVPYFEKSLQTLADRDKYLFFGLYIFPVSFHISEVSEIFEINEDKCKEILDSLTSKSVVNRVSGQVYDLHPVLKAFSEYKANFDPDKKLKIETAYCKFYGEMATVLAAMTGLKLSQIVEESRAIPKLLLAARLLLKQLSNYQLEQNPSSTTTSTTAMDTYRSTYTAIIQNVYSIASVFKELQLFREAQDLSEECSQLSKAMSSQTEISVQG